VTGASGAGTVPTSVVSPGLPPAGGSSPGAGLAACVAAVDAWYARGCAGSAGGAGAPGAGGGGSGSAGAGAPGAGAGSGTATTTAAGGGAGSGTSSGVTVTGPALQIFTWTNAVRAQHGLPPLRDNALLDRVALAKCQDMVQNNYFGDNSPTYGTPYQMQQAFGVHAPIMGGQNIAGAATVALAFFLLETSPPHLANMLWPGITDVGDAVVPVAPAGVYVCQEFAGY
jgi:uncharacterized protein YkwD